MTRSTTLAALPELRRTRFFDGRILTADDLAREQEYHRNRSRLQNRLLHGWGVADGLEVRSTGGVIHVSPGVAVDQRGEFVIVRDQCVVPVPPASSAKASCYVVARWCEHPADPLPALSGADGDPVVHATMVEGAELLVTDTPPRASDTQVAIARLIWRTTQWRVDVRFRRRTVRG